MATNTVCIVAGSGVSGFGGDGGSALLAQLRAPRGVAVTADGGYVIADTGNHRIRRVAPDGLITTVAGTTRGLAGDEGPATSARLDQPRGVAVAADGSILVADTGNHRIRRVSPDGIITTIAGTAAGMAGDGGPATEAQLGGPQGVAVTADGGLLIADTDNGLVRRVSPDGTITTAAGGPGGPAGPQLSDPVGVAPVADGGFLVADRSGQRVALVSTDGAIANVAGTGGRDNFRDAGPATSTAVLGPCGAAALPDGGLLVADTSHGRVRRVSASGRIITIAGGGAAVAVDGRSATDVRLDPFAIALTGDGGCVVADTAGNRVLFVDAGLPFG